MARHGKYGPRSERGQVLPITALAMVAMLALAALAIDVGRMTLTRRQLQNAADAAAHAGVQVLPEYPDAARNAASTWAARNGTTTSDGLLTTITKTTVDNDTITVTVTRNVPYTFARVLNLFSATISASASATVASVTGGQGIMPFGLVDLNGPNTPGFGYTFGQQVALREVPGNHFGPGNYGFLALDGPGGNVLRDTIANGGSRTFFRVGDRVRTKTGQNQGPATQGLTAWAASHNDAMGSSCDDWPASHSYVNGKLQVVARCTYRVILIPIIDHWPNGSQEVTILGFAQMYLAGWNGGDGRRLNAIFLDDSYAHPNIALGAINDYGTRVVRLRQ